MGFRELFSSAHYPLFFLLFAHRTYCIIVHSTLLFAPANARNNIERMFWGTRKLAFANNDGSTALLDAAQALFYSPLPNWRNEGIGRLFRYNGCIEITPLPAQPFTLIAGNQVESMNAN